MPPSFCATMAHRLRSTSPSSTPVAHHTASFATAHPSSLGVPVSHQNLTFDIKIPDFKDVVLNACQQPPHGAIPSPQLQLYNLAAMATRLRTWSKTLFSQAKLQLHMATEVILWLDIAQEYRQLSPLERGLRAGLKKRVMGLAVIDRSRKRQNSRITNLRDGDANTKFFHLKTNSRRCKNQIQRLQNGQRWAISHEEKLRHFQDMMSPLNTRVRTQHTSPQVVVDLLDVGKRINKTPIVVGNCTGFAVNRMFFPYTQSALLFVDRGMDVYKIDCACTKFGMPMGAPFRLADLVDFGVAVATGMQYLQNFPERVYKSMLIPLMTEDKRAGEATRKGFYKYEDKREATPDPEIMICIEKSRSIAGVTPEPEIWFHLSIFCYSNFLLP